MIIQTLDKQNVSIIEIEAAIYSPSEGFIIKTENGDYHNVDERTYDRIRFMSPEEYDAAVKQYYYQIDSEIDAQRELYESPYHASELM